MTTVTVIGTTGKAEDDQITVAKTGMKIGGKEMCSRNNRVVTTMVGNRSDHPKTTRNNNHEGRIISHSGRHKIKITIGTGNNPEATMVADNHETGHLKITSPNSRGEIMRILSHRRHR